MRVRLLYLVLFLFVCCASIKPEQKTNIYQIINLSLERLATEENDTIFVAKKTYSNYILRIIKNKAKYIKRMKGDDLKDIFYDNLELNNLIKQIDTTHYIDFKQINSQLVKEYIDPFKRLDSQGELIVDDYFLSDYKRKRYTLSKPIFTTDKKFGFILISKKDAYSTIQVFKKNNGKWKHFDYILIGIA